MKSLQVLKCRVAQQFQHLLHTEYIQCNIIILINIFKENKTQKYTFRDNSMDKNFLLSPIKKALLTTGNAALTLFSINTGGMFSPPAVINNS